MRRRNELRKERGHTSRAGAGSPQERQSKGRTGRFGAAPSVAVATAGRGPGTGIIHERGQRASNPDSHVERQKESHRLRNPGRACVRCTSRVRPAGYRETHRRRPVLDWYGAAGGWCWRFRLQVCCATRQNLAAVSRGRSTNGAVGKGPRKASHSSVSRGHQDMAHRQWCASSAFLRGTNAPPKGRCNTV